MGMAMDIVIIMAHDIVYVMAMDIDIIIACYSLLHCMVLKLLFMAVA